MCITSRTKITSRVAAMEAMELRRLLSTVTGTVFADNDRDGRLDADELGVDQAAIFANRTVYADYNYNGVLDSGEPRATSNFAGQYELSTRAENVSLRVVLNANEQVTFGYGATSIWIPQVNGTVTGKHIGIASAAPVNQIAGTVYADANKNGRRDEGEAGIAGRTVFGDYNYNGTLDASEPRALTDASGNYVLATRGEQVSVRVVTQSGEEITLGYGATSLWVPVVNGTVSGKNFGLAGTPSAGQVTGAVFFDSNRNNRKDAGESALAGRTVFADYNYNGVLDANESRATTDAGGNYTLATRAQNVDLRVVLNSGEVVTLGYGAQSYWLSAVNGTVSGKNFGIAGTAMLRLRYFADYNQDGSHDWENETPLANDYGNVAFVDANANNVLDAGEIVSQPDGAQYGIDALYLYGLLPGTHRIVVATQLPSGEYVVGGAARMITVPYGQYGDDYYYVPIGGYPLSRVDLNIFLDTNGNGQYDSQEPTLEDSTVYADYNLNGQLDAGEPSATDPSYNPLGQTSLTMPTRNVAIRFILPEGYRIQLPGGADHLLVELTTPTRRFIRVAATPIV